MVNIKSIDNLFGLPLTATTLNGVMSSLNNKAETTPLIVTFINPHAYFLAKNNLLYKDMLSNFDMVLPDGFAVQKMAQYVFKVICDRLSFDTTSLSIPVFKYAETTHKTVALVGAKPEIILQAKQQIQQAFPNLKITLTLDGYQSKESITNKLMTNNPDLVICGMGAPHQEELLIMLKKRGWTGIGFTCGGYFDQLIGGLKYYPAWADRWNLRFLYRFFKEPKRLWRRYLIEYRVFIGHSIRAFLSFK